jgi:hypothetical protein
MPRRVRRRAIRTQVALDPETLAALKQELPPWLEAYLLDRTSPDRGTAAGSLLDQLTLREPYGPGHYVLPENTPLAKVWKHHRKSLLARWAAEGRKDEPFAARQIDRDPNDPDPREVLTPEYEARWQAERRAQEKA